MSGFKHGKNGPLLFYNGKRVLEINPTSAPKGIAVQYQVSINTNLLL
jgi:hypothetical protein